MGRRCTTQITDKEPTKNFVPLNKMQVDYLLQTDNNWWAVLACYLGSIDNHYPEDLF